MKPDIMKRVHSAERRVGGFVRHKEIRKKKEKKEAESTAAGGDGESR